MKRQKEQELITLGQDSSCNERNHSFKGKKVKKPVTVKVLLVFKDEEFLMLGKTHLEKNDRELTVDTATSPDQAISLIMSRSHDIIVTGYNLFSKNGLQFFEELDRREIDTPVKMVLDEQFDILELNPFDPGINPVIQKAVEIQRLLRDVQSSK
ncbi:MAG: response regulator [Candidatus Odinarchaeota archaeon]